MLDIALLTANLLN
uniref:Uncharacterized protein n=1 Tax=Megaselia scalaris TaxID=36166 RepID=T1H6R5_MEGSC